MLQESSMLWGLRSLERIAKHLLMSGYS